MILISSGGTSRRLSDARQRVPHGPHLYVTCQALWGNQNGTDDRKETRSMARRAVRATCQAADVRSHSGTE